MKRKVKKKMKYCLVRNCGIDSVTSPNKLFIRVPTNSQSKERWFRAIDVSPTRSRKSNCQFCCEDHFDLQNDAENFMEFKTIGVRLRIKKNVVPHLNLNIHEISEESQFSSSEKILRKSNLERFKRFKEIGVGTTPPRKFAASKKNRKCYSSVSDCDSNSLASSEDLIEQLQRNREMKVGDDSYSSTSSANLTECQRFKDVGVCTSPPGEFSDEEEIENSVLFLNQLTNNDREMNIVFAEKEDPLMTPDTTNNLNSVTEDLNKKQLTTQDQEMNIIVVEEEKEDVISGQKSVADLNKINNNKQLTNHDQEKNIAFVEEKEDPLIMNNKQLTTQNKEIIKEVIKIKEEVMDELELNTTREKEKSSDQIMAAPEFIGIKEEYIEDQYIENEKENHKTIVKDSSEFCERIVKVEPEADSVQNSGFSASENKKFKCLMCSEAFSDAISLKTHASAHIKSITGVKCSICKRNCVSNSDLKRHLKGHMNVLFLMQNLSKTF